MWSNGPNALSHKANSNSEDAHDWAEGRCASSCGIKDERAEMTKSAEHH